MEAEVTFHKNNIRIFTVKIFQDQLFMAGRLYYTCLFANSAPDQPEFLEAEAEILCKDQDKGKPVILQFSAHAKFSLLHEFLSEVLVLK